MGKFTLKHVLILFIVAFSAWAMAPTTQQTTMTWVVASAKSFSTQWGGSCSTTLFYFVETDAQMDSDVDGNGAKVAPNSSSAGGAGTACQDANNAGMTLTNNGNVVTNIDGNFTGAFGGADLNLVLKVWMGTGGTIGPCGFQTQMRGWESPCSVTAAGNPVTNTTCRAFDKSNDMNTGRLVSSLAVGDSNTLCFSGDFNIYVSSGSHAVTWLNTVT